MQEQVNVQPQATLEQIHELMVIELSLQQIIHRYLCTRSRNDNGASRALEFEYADFVTRDGQVDLIPFRTIVATPRYKHALVGKCARTVLVGSEFGRAARTLQLTFVVVLLGKGQEEAFFAGLC